MNNISLQTTPRSALKEIRPQGAKTFPCEIYQTRTLEEKGILVKHHWHDEIEILHFSGGEFTVEINMEKFHVRGECLYFINPGELHSIYCDRSGKEKTCGEDAIVFHPGLLSFETCDSAQLNLIQPLQNEKILFPRFLTPEHPAFSPVLEAFTEIFQSFGVPLSEENPIENGAFTDDLTSQLYIKSSLLRILAVLSRYRLLVATDPNHNKKMEGIKKALTYIWENYDQKIYISDLASLLNINEQYFCRYFKKAIGRSPIEYLNEYRIKQAMRLLETTDQSVMDICLECGYNNLGNFFREFRKHTSTTPLKYRKSQNNGI
ncbi:MAG: AraC family transcriptional regulator [Clostridiales bacterium]|nr:AraC family transcriptional regulator [Clostridiales bacterium]